MENYKETSDFLNDAIDDFNLNLFKFVLKKSLLWILLLFIGVIGLGQVILRYSPRIYETTASLILKKNPETMKVLGVDNILQTDDAEIYREIQLLKSHIIIERVLDSMDSEVSYYRTGRTRFIKTEMYGASPFELKNLKIFNFNVQGDYIDIIFNDESNYTVNYSVNGKDKVVKGKLNRMILNEDFSFKIVPTAHTLVPNSKMGFILNNRDDLIEYYSSKLDISQIIPQTQSLQIKLKDENVNKSLAFINALVNTFISFDKQRKAESVDNILGFLNNQIDTFTNQYNTRNDTFSKRTTLDNLFSPDLQIKDNIERLKELEQRIEILENNLRYLEKIIQKNDHNIESYLSSLSAAKEGVFPPRFYDLLHELELFQKEREELLIDYKPNNPNIEILNKKIDLYLFNLKDQLKAALQETNYEKDLYAGKYQNITNKLLTIPEKVLQYDKDKKEASNREKFLFNLIDKQAQYLVAEAGIVSDYLILSPPYCSNNAIYPQVKTIRLITIVLFLFASILLILARYFTYQFVTSVKEIKKKVNSPVLGVIPRYTEEQMVRSKVVVTLNPKSKISESFRGIRANIQFISSGDKAKIVATTSTIPGEGKTFVNINLAAIHSVLDKKVVLLDLDMRKPRLAKIFGIQSNVGMSTLLIGQSKLEDTIHQTNYKNLDVITSGPVPPNPSELILSKQLDIILNQLREKYDFIFIDTPPIGLVTDALELLAKADVPLYVVRADFTRKEFLNNIEKLVIENKLKKLSIVVNDFGRGASGEMYEYGYGYGYTYSQGEGYYTQDKKPKKKNLLSYLKDWKLIEDIKIMD